MRAVRPAFFLALGLALGFGLGLALGRCALAQPAVLLPTTAPRPMISSLTAAQIGHILTSDPSHEFAVEMIHRAGHWGHTDGDDMPDFPDGDHDNDGLPGRDDDNDGIKDLPDRDDLNNDVNEEQQEEMRQGANQEGGPGEGYVMPKLAAQVKFNVSGSDAGRTQVVHLEMVDGKRQIYIRDYPGGKYQKMHAYLPEKLAEATRVACAPTCRSQTRRATP